MMTLKEVHGMFAVGQVWDAKNTYRPMTSGQRTLIEKRPTLLIWRMPNFDQFFMNSPVESQIIEAADGLLVSKLFDEPDKAHFTVTLRRIS